MKIVHLIDYFQPALGYQETFLAREQLRLGHEVTVLTSDRYAPFADYDRTSRPVLGERLRTAGASREEGIAVQRLPVRFERSSRCWLKGLRQALSTLRPDVVHAHGAVKFSTLRAAWLKPRLGYRLLVDDHMHRVNLNTSRAGRLFYWAFRQCCAPMLRRRVDALAAITEETRTIVQEVYGLRCPAAQVIEMGVDIERFCRDETAGQALRHQLELQPQDFLVLYTGKVIPAKAPHALLEALPQCPAQVKILFVGNAAAEYRRQLDQIITAQGLEQRVLFRPAVKQADLPVYYSAANAGCWPREASIAMLEAAACALPIIISKAGSSDRVRAGNGLEFPEGDTAELARCITQLATDPETQAVLTSVAMMNMEGEGINDIRKYFRKKLVRMGVVEPNEAEQEEMLMEMQNQQPDPNALFLQASAMEAEAKAVKAQADAVKAQADTEYRVAQTAETKASTLKTLAELENDEQRLALETAERLTQTVDQAFEIAQEPVQQPVQQPFNVPQV